MPPPLLRRRCVSGALITAQGLACQRGARTLWQSVDFSAPAGGALHIVGANGVGKSSLLRIIAGLLPAMAGRVTCHGSVALLDENPALDRDQSLAGALGFWAAIDGVTDGAAGVDAALNAVGMAVLADVPVRYFSTGQRKRAALARLLVQGAPIWLLDEPSNGLDHAGVAMLEGLIAAHRADGGCAIIASHQPLQLADMRALSLQDYSA